MKRKSRSFCIKRQPLPSFPFYQLFGNHRPPLDFIIRLLDRICNNECGTLTNLDLIESNIDPTRPVWFISHFAHTRYLLYCKRNNLSMFWLVQEILPYIRSARKKTWRHKMQMQGAVFNYNMFIMIILQVVSSHELSHLKTVSYILQDEIVNLYIGYPLKTEEAKDLQFQELEEESEGEITSASTSKLLLSSSSETELSPEEEQVSESPPISDL